MKALSLTHSEATEEKLLALARQIPGAWIGIKIAVLLLILEGQRPGWVNPLFGVTRMTTERWIRVVNQNGIQALIPKPRPGRPSQLVSSLREQLQRQLEKSPQEFGLSRAAWDGPALVVHLKKQFGIKLKVRQAQYWLHYLGYSLKRASYVYLQSRATDARHFRKELKKLRCLKDNETIVFQDETGFSLHPRLGRGWSKKGKRLKVATTSQHRQRLNLSGWVAPLLGRKGLIRTAKGNSEGFVQVLRHMLKKLHGYIIHLYVDGAKWHKGDAVRLFLKSHTEIHLEYLPPYQPALNEQENIWRQGRYEVTRNVWFESLDIIYIRFKRKIDHWSDKRIKQLCIIS